MGPVDNTLALVQIIAWHRTGDEPLSEPMKVGLPSHICVTWSQWVKAVSVGDKSELLTCFCACVRECMHSGCTCSFPHQELHNYRQASQLRLLLVLTLFQLDRHYLDWIKGKGRTLSRFWLQFSDVSSDTISDYGLSNRLREFIVWTQTWPLIRAIYLLRHRFIIHSTEAVEIILLWSKRPSLCSHLKGCLICIYATSIYDGRL